MIVWLTTTINISIHQSSDLSKPIYPFFGLLLEFFQPFLQLLLRTLLNFLQLNVGLVSAAHNP